MLSSQRRIRIFVYLVAGALVSCAEPVDLDRADALLADGQTEAAYTAYGRLSEQGNARADFALALFHRNGWGRPVDEVEGCRLLERAATGEVPAAHHWLAECLETAIHRESNEGEIIQHYRTAAELGYVLSWCSLARLDPAQPLEPCRAVTLDGSAPAMEALADLLAGGRPGARDLPEARRLLEQAAGRDSPTAALRLGRMLRDGAFGTPEKAAAARWLERAASLRLREAYLETGAHYLGELADLAHSKPTDEQLARAYLWLRAAERDAPTPEARVRAAALLETVRELMPPTWQPKLEVELERFFEAANRKA